MLARGGIGVGDGERNQPVWRVAVGVNIGKVGMGVDGDVGEGRRGAEVWVSTKVVGIGEEKSGDSIGKNGTGCDSTIGVGVNSGGNVDDWEI